MEAPLLGDAAGRPPPPDARDGSGAVATTVLCVDCRRLLIWRGGGTNRRAWKAFCSLCLVLEMAIYFHVTYGLRWRIAPADGPVDDYDALLTSRTLLVTGALTLSKFMIEIWGQETPNWVCPGGPVMFFVVFFLIIPGVIYTDGTCSRNADLGKLLSLEPPYRQLSGFALFLLGSAYSLSYEVGRFRWKQKEENVGRLHTEGLARYSIHPNYLGDLFTYAGWGLVVGTTCALSMPAAMLWSFAFFVCPNSDAYLAERYRQGKEDGRGSATASFAEYAERTATLIPGIRGRAANYALGCLGFAGTVCLGGRCAVQCG